MKDEVEELYKNLFVNTNQFFSSFLVLQIIEQWKLNEMVSEYKKIIDKNIEDGSLFVTKNNTISMPLIFIEKLFEKFGSEWETLKNYISKGIKGEISFIDIELFPCYFYAFKVYLYQNLKINSCKMSQFFKGVYMKEVKFFNNNRKIWIKF